jgi:flagellin
MPTVINTNLASLFAQNSLSNAQNNLAQSVQRLSSGLRINSAKDDAAGLSISQNMQSQIVGTNQSVRNLNDATNLLQVADSSLATIQDMLLRLKQLATQGYDGSLSIPQKLNIVQEMKDLNAEINATAQRTQFNGINLLTSGSTVDLNNSDIRSGVALSTAAVAVDRATAAKTGIYSTGGTSASTGLADADLGADSTAASTSTTFSIALDPDLLPRTPGTYTFTSNGNNLTLTGTFNGLAQSQTVTVADALANDVAGALKVTNQTLNFDSFGISLNLSSNRAAGDKLLGSAIASQLASANYKSLVIDGEGSEITDVRLSNVAPGTYTLSYDSTENKVTISGTVNGIATTQAVALSDGVANTSQTLNFSAFGVQIDIWSYQNNTNDEIGAELAALNGGSPSTAGQLVVSSGNNSALKFQSGPNSDAFIQIDTLNVQTGTTGQNAGQSSDMMTLGTRITGSAAGNLGTLGSTNTIEQWQTAFKNAAAAVDNALEYISTERATFGSQMNRLSYVSTNLQAQSTNLQNSRSAIIDTDFAAETARLTKGQIMQQAATAMLAQANQMPNVILSLLK